MQEVNERINVWVKFFNGKTVPVVFEWRGRRYTINRISLVFDRHDGDNRFLCFAVDSSGLIAELALDRSNFIWRITKCVPSYI